MPTRRTRAGGKRASTIDTENVPIAPDASGWTLHPSERRDFYHRIRVFPPEVLTWRREFLQYVRGNSKCFAAAEKPPDTLQELIDDGISHLREVARILAAVYSKPDLAGCSDPIDELICLVLTDNAEGNDDRESIKRWKTSIPCWDDFFSLPRRMIERTASSAGLSRAKTDAVYSILRQLRKTLGRCSLEPARNQTDEELERLLCSFPGVSRRNALQLMACCFGRRVLLADSSEVCRVLSRLGPYRELGLSFEGIDLRKRKSLIAEIVPPNLRLSLYANLLEHGRTVCRRVRPSCDTCELCNFCAHYRRNEVKRLENLDIPSVADLFAGAGGLSEGFEHAGFRILLALDQDAVAMRTYRLNHPRVPDERILVEDIRSLSENRLSKLVGRKQLDVLIGAPPCQGYSLIGSRSKKTNPGTRYRFDTDERNFLFEYMVSAALELRPRLFLMENVPGMQSAKKDSLSFLDTAARLLEEKGRYTTTIWRLNAAAFGVPQDRIRCFLVASSTGQLPARPEEEYHDLHRSGLDHDALPPVTLQEAIFDLPQRKAGEGTAVDRRDDSDPADDLRFRRYLTKFHIFRQSHLVYNHTVRYHNPRDLELYALLRPGEDSIHFLEKHGRHDLMRYRRDVFDDKYARLREDRPSKTIVAHLAKDGNGYIHPTQVRSISLREAARLQSFHDGYVFSGAPSDQWTQLGNAVPPILAQAIARSFLRELRRG